jgi:hypothetical protein
MAINYSGTKTETTELQEIQSELYLQSNTFVDRVIDIQEGHKSGADVYESRVDVEFSAASSAGVTATGDVTLDVKKTKVDLQTFEVKDVIDETTLKGTRFERSIAAGAFSHISDEFDRRVLIDMQPAIGRKLDQNIWNGATAETKTAIAALIAGAGQGSISASAKALVAAMPTTLFDSLAAKILYNDSQAKVGPGAGPGGGLGDYVKVAGTTITKDNIAEEYAKLYLGSPDEVLNGIEEPKIFAPFKDEQLMMAANNSVGAASNQNFVFEGGKAYYNSIEVVFVPLVGFRILTVPKYLKVLMDLVSDMSLLNIGQMANGAQQRYIKNIQTIATFVTNQRYITLYGG